MIEFLSNYPSACTLVICIIVGFCIFMFLGCLDLLHAKSHLCKTLAVIGILISITVPVGLTMLHDKVRSNTYDNIHIYINGNRVDYKVEKKR